ncbi:MAG: alpha/beta hydrolase [Deltaproteobacteria bacterium]|nr:alpha/beta hydrolase [Deltaproteobacteria bacterium]
MSLPPLVFLPPAGGNARAYEPLISALSLPLGGRHLEILEYPGRRPGTRPLDTVGDLAAFVEKKLGARGLEDAFLVGHSLGGAVALEVALRGAARLSGLILIGTGGRLRVHPMILEMMRTAAAEGQPVPPPALAFGPGASEDLIDRVAQAWSETHPAGALGDWEAVNTFDRLADLARISLPTLVLCGEADQMTPRKYSEKLAEAIAGAQLLVHPGAGHLIPWEEPDWLARHIAEFVS